MSSKWWERRSIMTDVLLEQELEVATLRRKQLEDEMLLLKQEAIFLKEEIKRVKKKNKKLRKKGKK
jgi:hypothetical protein